MLLVTFDGKTAYNASKISGVLRGGALGANRGYVLGHCGEVAPNAYFCSNLIRRGFGLEGRFYDTFVVIS